MQQRGGGMIEYVESPRDEVNNCIVEGGQMQAVDTERKFDERIGIQAETKRRLIDLLNQQLADTADLYSQAKQAHWNVKGSQFYQLHELFDHLAAELAGHADLLAERVTALGGLARGTVRMAA